jgi:hypothetical protein
MRRTGISHGMDLTAAMYVKARSYRYTLSPPSAHLGKAHFEQAPQPNSNLFKGEWFEGILYERSTGLNPSSAVLGEMPARQFPQRKSYLQD